MCRDRGRSPRQMVLPMKAPTFATLLCLPLPLLAAERDDALKLPDVLISASRQIESRTATSAANTVFTRTDIDRL